MNATLFLSRAQHDELLTESPKTVERLFKECKSRQWSLAGVRFEGLPQSLVDKVVDSFEV